MLERATACLKAGARDTLRCAHRTTRSKRRLHSTFWAHGAGGLDLPPWAVSMLPMPADLPLKHDNTESKRDMAPAGSSSIGSHDGVFLDFLYPPQALAWLHGTNGQCWERWEKRNARRLPEGFIQAPRGYSVRSYGKSSAAAARKQQRKDKSMDLVYEVAGVNRYGVSSSPHDESSVGPHDEQEHDQQSFAENVVRTEPFDGQGEPENEFADTPGELAEAAIAENIDDPLEALRDLMAGRRGRGIDATSQAWSLYNLLNDDERVDANLKSRLLAFLAARNNDVADAHCISLYYALSLKDRHLPIYQATMAAFLRRNDVDFALGLHAEALTNIANGHQISKDLFTYAVDHELWEVALQVQVQHHKAYEEAGQSNQVAIFWLHVSEMPNLMDASAGLYDRIGTWEKEGKADLDAYGRLCAKMSEEALWQFLQAPLPESIPQRKLYRIVDAIRRWSPHAANILEDAISSFLAQLGNSHDEYARAHHVVSYLYQSYRKCGIPRAPEWMLMSLLHKVVRLASSLRSLSKGSRTITVNMIVTHWTKDYDTLGVSALHELLSFYASMGLPASVQKWFDYLCQWHPDYPHRKDILWSLIYVHARRADIRMAISAFNGVEKLAKANNDEVPVKCWNILVHAYSRVDDLDGGLATFKRLLAAGVKPDAYQVQPIAEMLARRGDVEGVRDIIEQFETLVQEKRNASLTNSYIQALVNRGDVETAGEVLEDSCRKIKTGEMLGSLTISFNILITAYALRRDMEMAMHVYEKMQAMKTRANNLTYSALMQGLIQVRQTDRAQRILTTILPRLGLRPTALHYAIVIAGYTNQGLYQEAVDFYARMIRHNVKPTLATHRAYLRAKSLLEHSMTPLTNQEGESAPLQEVITELEEALVLRDGSEIASKGPGFGYSSYDRGQAVAGHIDSVMYVHGTRRCLDAVAEMFRLYREQTPDQAHEPPPMRILSALMNALLHAGEYKEVEAYWELAKRQADLIAPTQTVPDFRPAAVASEPEIQKELSFPLPGALASSDVDRAEIGFDSGSEPPAVSESQVLDSDSGSEPPVVPESQVLPVQSATSVGPRPAPGRRYILNHAVRHYIASLHQESRTRDLVEVCTRMVAQGYALDNVTWNRLIVHLCNASPPLVLLAFHFTERFLIPTFPGWMPLARTKFPPRRSKRAQRLQHIRASYLPPGLLMPHYHTMVHLAGAYLKLRKLEATRGLLRRRDRSDTQRLVGSIEEIRRQAPKTVEAMQRMPSVNDEIQHRLLDSQD